ncbi:MAG: FAD-binding domain-containing protein [Paracoccaceae bacterium]
MTVTDDLFADLPDPPEIVAFEPTRRAGLARLENFASRTGAHYAANRNYDLGPAQRSTVSALSPWIRHRLITEEEILTQTLARHSPNAAMKFIQEVFWRGYFKGWLQHHPSVWKSYQHGLKAAQSGLERDVHHNTDYQSAIEGRTGIACFDHWCRELKETGYLHNHARMWFASIWIFTLRLPWELGAHFFLTHLIDGDPASNTLSWRWVGGLHTKGKTYLARPSNIAKYTQGAFEPIGQLAQSADPLIENDIHPFVPFTPGQSPVQSDFLLLVTEEDCQPETFISVSSKDVVGLVFPNGPDQGAHPHAFKKGAVTDAVMRLGGRDNATATNDWASAIIKAAQQAGTSQVLTAFAPVGPVATELASLENALAPAGIALHQQQRPYDAITWPHATKGFFKLKKMIPTILSDLGFSDAQTF